MLHNKRFAHTLVVDLATRIFKGLFFSWAVHLIFAMVFWHQSLVVEMWWCLIIILIWTLLVPYNYKYSIWKTEPFELVSWSWWEMCLFFSGILKKAILQPSKRIHYGFGSINIRRDVYAFPKEGTVLISTHSPLPFL